MIGFFPAKRTRVDLLKPWMYLYGTIDWVSLGQNLPLYNNSLLFNYMEKAECRYSGYYRTSIGKIKTFGFKEDENVILFR